MLRISRHAKTLAKNAKISFRINLVTDVTRRRFCSKTAGASPKFSATWIIACTLRRVRSEARRDVYNWFPMASLNTSYMVLTFSRNAVTSVIVDCMKGEKNERKERERERERERKRERDVRSQDPRLTIHLSSSEY